MEKLIAELDSIMSTTPSSSNIIGGAQSDVSQRSDKNESLPNAAVEDVLGVCCDQAKKIRDLSRENLEFRENIRQLKSALNFAHQLTDTLCAEKIAAKNAMFELNRHLEMTIKEKKMLEDGLRRAQKYLEELRSKETVDLKKLEDYKCRFEELQLRCKSLEKKAVRLEHSNCEIRDEENISSKQLGRVTVQPGSVSVDQFVKLQLSCNSKLADKNKKIKEMAERSRQQNEIILEQGEEIAALKVKIELLTEERSSTVSSQEEKGGLRTFFRRSFSVRRKKTKICNGPRNEHFL